MYKVYLFILWDFYPALPREWVQSQKQNLKQ